MYDYQSFKQVLRGFDKDEVISCLQKMEDEHKTAVAELARAAGEKEKELEDLRSRLARRTEKCEQLENEIETKYKKYIENYDKIGSLIYDAQIRADEIIAEAEEKAKKIEEDSRAKGGRIIAEADVQARKRIDSVQSEVDAKLADGKRRYMKVQDQMNDILEMINEAQRKFMNSYKEVHEVIQNMPFSLSEMDPQDDPEGDQDEEDFETGELDFMMLQPDEEEEDFTREGDTAEFVEEPARDNAEAGGDTKDLGSGKPVYMPDESEGNFRLPGEADYEERIVRYGVAPESGAADAD